MLNTLLAQPRSPQRCDTSTLRRAVTPVNLLSLLRATPLAVELNSPPQCILVIGFTRQCLAVEGVCTGKIALSARQLSQANQWLDFTTLNCQCVVKGFARTGKLPGFQKRFATTKCAPICRSIYQGTPTRLLVGIAVDAFRIAKVIQCLLVLAAPQIDKPQATQYFGVVGAAVQGVAQFALCPDELARLQ